MENGHIGGEVQGKAIIRHCRGLERGQALAAAHLTAKLRAVTLPARFLKTLSEGLSFPASALPASHNSEDVSVWYAPSLHAQLFDLASVKVTAIIADIK